MSLKSDSDDEDEGEDDEADKVVQKPESDEKKKVTKGKQTKAKVEKSKQTEAKVEKGKQTKTKVEKKATTATKVEGKEPAAKKRRVKTGTMAQRLGAGAVYVGHLPYGFHKEQMMGMLMPTFPTS